MPPAVEPRTGGNIHAIRIDADVSGSQSPPRECLIVDSPHFPAREYEVVYTCSARCCLEELVRRDVAPGEYVFTGSGRWHQYTWGVVAEPRFAQGHVCAACGLPLSTVGSTSPPLESSIPHAPTSLTAS